MDQKHLNKIFTQTEQEIENEIQEEPLPEHEAEIQIANKELVQEISEIDKIQDADYSRRVLQNLLTKGQELLNIAMENAADGKARDVEVAGGVLNTVAGLSEKLVTIHENINNMRKKTSVDPNQGNTYINNQSQTIVMTTDDLLRKILDKKETEINAIGS